MAEPLTKDKIVITIPVFETYVTLENLKSALDEFENLSVDMVFGILSELWRKILVLENLFVYLEQSLDLTEFQ